MKKRKCAVCGKVKTVDKMGDGCRVPKTTCLDCKAKVAELVFAEIKTIMFIKRIVKGEV